MKIEKLLVELEADDVYDDLDMQQLIDINSKAEVIQLVLKNVGHPHSLVRENILGILYRLVVEEHLSHSEYISILNTCLGDVYLFKGIGNRCDLAVFTRAFSSLYICHIMDLDGKHDFLSQDQYLLALNKGIHYMNQEVDRRGYVSGNGWAHAVAHGADMICALVRNPKFSLEFANDVLGCLASHVTSSDRFMYAEEVRLAKIIPALLEKGLCKSEFKNWIESMLPQVKVTSYTDEHHSYVCILFNIASFLRVTYFLLGEDPKHGELCTYISHYVPTMWARAHETT